MSTASSQSYDSDISPQNISRPISSESKKDDFSDEEIETDMQHGTWTNAGTFIYLFIYLLGNQ